MTEQPLSQSAVSVRAGRTRFMMLALVFINIIINYMDRTNLSVAATQMAGELRFTPLEMGLIFSAFGWIYAALQIPGGFLIDRLGARLVYGAGLFAWSLITALHAFASSFGALFGLRLGVGAFEAPVMPANNRVISSWFPEQERASAIGIYSSAQFVGLACMTPLLFHVQAAFGWRGLFLITGVAGMIWALVWYLLYREPNQHKGVSEAELNYLRDNGALLENRQDSQPPRARSASILASSPSRRPSGFSSPGFLPIWWSIATWTLSRAAMWRRCPTSRRFVAYCWLALPQTA